MSLLNKKCQIIILLIFIILGCGKTEKPNTVTQGILIDFLKSHVDDKEYEKIYTQANDSLKTWCNNKLTEYAELWYFTYKLDSLMCFNKENNKMVGAILLPCNKKDCKMDDIRYFYGVKIVKKWYFFDGPSMALSQEKSHTPKSFLELHEIAIKNIFKGYLTKDEKGQWQINDGFFYDLTSNAWYLGKRPQTQAQWDSVYLGIVRDNWKKRDTTNYKPTQ